MLYDEILNNPLLNLPYAHSGKSVERSIKNLLAAYLYEVQKLDDASLHIQELEYITGRFVKDSQLKFVAGLLKTIDTYHNGKPAESFKTLSTTFDSDLKNYREILKFHEYDADESFFRMRLKKDNFPLERLDMFHIPFEKRGLIKTQRYSIPGFPCLYLGRTIYGCWEEMNRPDINEYQVVRLKNVKKIRFLDLTRPKFENDARSKEAYHYFMTWPLIACCSIIVDDYGKSFKSEYIIPQLLLQWIRENETIDGIKFSSTHIDLNNSKSEGDFSNLVLPVKKNFEKGHCTDLKSMFEMSNPISWQLHENSLGGQVFVTGSGTGGVDDRIQKLELIGGRPYPYSYSVFGKLESYLDGMETLPI